MFKNYAIILASGTGSRYGSELPKQFLKINNKTILEHSIEAFENNKSIDAIILVITPDYKNLAEEIVSKSNYKKLIKILSGGKTRKDSSYIGVMAVDEDEANVLIHDCARPLVSQNIINNCIEALGEHEAVDVAIPVADTIVEISENIIKKLPERKFLRRSQTPQCFRLSLIKKAHELAKNDDNFTDDCGLVFKYNLSEIYVAEGEEENIKITYPNDIFIAEKIIENKCR